ncbi:MAG: DegT/DnrJ/EryC1/StrS family aminotransferase [Ramlibacter sp.]
MISNTPVIPVFSSSIANRDMGLAQALNRVLDSNHFVMGQEVAQFEQEFALYNGLPHCIAVANGTDALELALRAVGAGPGSSIACVANAGFYSSTAIQLVGASPVYVEVDEKSLTLSPQALQAALAQRPAAVMATHLYGQMAAIEEIATMCRAAGVPLIEDCAQSHGAVRGGRRAGAFGDIACFSFYPTKNLGALGDGGAVLTSSAELAATVKSLRQYGWASKYQVARLGGRNSRLDEMQAAVLREKLRHLDRQNAQRRAIAARYNVAFGSLPLRLPVSVGEDFVAHLYVVRTPRRDALRAFLLDRGIATDVHYPIADTRQPAWAGRFDSLRLEVTEAACAGAVSLPCFPGMAGEDVERVVQAVTAFFRVGA